MKLVQTLGLTALLLLSGTGYAETGSHDGMPMECKQKHRGMMNPGKMAKMQNMMQMRQKHMQAMEQRLANIEALLKELVALEKQKK